MSTINDLPPSATLVFKVLEYRGPLTYSELRDETSLPESTLTTAISKLRAEGLATRQYTADGDHSHIYISVSQRQ